MPEAIPAIVPSIEGEVRDGMILRQHAGEGSLGDAKIFLSGTTGFGGFALIVEVQPKNKERVYVVYDGSKVVEEVAQMVIDGKLKPAPRPEPKGA